MAVSGRRTRSQQRQADLAGHAHRHGLPDHAVSVLVLYPAMVRLDPTLTEAARTLGASPVRAFFNIVLPTLRNTLLATVIMSFIFALGSYLLPQILGRPRHWTLSVLITDQALYQSNMPFAAAMAVFLVLISLALIALTLLVGSKKAPAS